jgi:hypothetical protein
MTTNLLGDFGLQAFYCHLQCLVGAMNIADFEGSKGSRDGIADRKFGSEGGYQVLWGRRRWEG